MPHLGFLGRTRETKSLLKVTAPLSLGSPDNESHEPFIFSSPCFLISSSPVKDSLFPGGINCCKAIMILKKREEGKMMIKRRRNFANLTNVSAMLSNVQLCFQKMVPRPFLQSVSCQTRLIDPVVISDSISADAGIKSSCRCQN